MGIFRIQPHGRLHEWVAPRKKAISRPRVLNMSSFVLSTAAVSSPPSNPRTAVPLR